MSGYDRHDGYGEEPGGPKQRDTDRGVILVVIVLAAIIGAAYWFV